MEPDRAVVCGLLGAAVILPSPVDSGAACKMQRPSLMCSPRKNTNTVLYNMQYVKEDIGIHITFLENSMMNFKWFD